MAQQKKSGLGISKEKGQVSAMFNKIAPKYDFLNHFLSAGIDKRWRKAVVRKLEKIHPSSILDVATGTGDLAIRAAQLNPDKIVGVDIAIEMLEIGRIKINKKGLTNIITLQEGDSLSLDFPDNTFDASMVAFGVRNFANLEQGLGEMFRVLRSGGMIAVLEFSTPEHFPLKQLYRFYSRYMLPFLGKVISGDKQAYTYLPETVAAFPYGNEFVEILSGVGFKNVECKVLSGGIASLYTGLK